MGADAILLVLFFEVAQILCRYSLEETRREAFNDYPQHFRIYSRTSMARTSLGPQKIVRDMGSSCH